MPSLLCDLLQAVGCRVVIDLLFGISLVCIIIIISIDPFNHGSSKRQEIV